MADPWVACAHYHLKSNVQLPEASIKYVYWGVTAYGNYTISKVMSPPGDGGMGALIGKGGNHEAKRESGDRRLRLSYPSM